MSKYNERASARPRAKITKNEEGAPAYEMNSKLELFTRACTALMGEPQFYDTSGRNKDDAIVRLTRELSKSDPRFIANLASFTRNVMNLRTVPSVMLTELASEHRGDSLVRQAAPLVVKRADELTGVVAYWLSTRGSKSKFPNGLKKGLADAAEQFDEWQVGRYLSNDKQVKMRDVLRLIDMRAGRPWSRELHEYVLTGHVHSESLPKIAAQQRLNKLDNELTDEAKQLIADGHATWEQAVSKFGNKKETWEAVLPHMGIMAQIRNLRNLLDAGVDVSPVLARLNDPEQVRRSRQLPFRFYAAFKELNGGNDMYSRRVARSKSTLLKPVNDALENALASSVQNIPPMRGHTVIGVDLSGSMTSPVSQKSSIYNYEIAALLGALTSKAGDDCTISMFGDRLATFKPDPEMSILEITNRVANTEVGHSTHAYLVVDDLIKRKEHAERLILFSDMQCYSSGSSRWGSGRVALADQVRTYREQVNPLFKVYSVDLAGYGTAQFNEHDLNTVLLAGWSDRILEFVTMLERHDSLLSDVESGAFASGLKETVLA